MNVLHILRWLVKRGDRCHMRVRTQARARTALTQSVWFISRPLRRQSWAVDSVTAEQERNNFMDVDIEQQTLTRRARITGNQPWPLGVTEGKRDGEGAWMALHLDLVGELQSKAEQSKKKWTVVPGITQPPSVPWLVPNVSLIWP